MYTKIRYYNSYSFLCFCKVKPSLCEIDLLCWKPDTNSTINYHFSTPPDLLIASDVLDDSDSMKPLCYTIFHFLNQGCKNGALIINEIKSKQSLLVFENTMKELGLRVADVPLDKNSGVFNLEEGGTLLDDAVFRAVHVTLDGGDQAFESVSS